MSRFEFKTPGAMSLAMTLHEEIVKTNKTAAVAAAGGHVILEMDGLSLKKFGEYCSVFHEEMGDAFWHASF